MKLREPDQYEVLRNTRTFQAYQARMAAANRVGMVFFIMPAILNPALFVPIFTVVLRRHLPVEALWMFGAAAGVWLALLIASVFYGLHLRQKYLRDHPWAGPVT